MGPYRPWKKEHGIFWGLNPLQVTQESVVLKNRYQMGDILEPGGPLQGILLPHGHIRVPRMMRPLHSHLDPNPNFHLTLSPGWDQKNQAAGGGQFLGWQPPPPRPVPLLPHLFNGITRLGSI